jgi:hypothetical protein
LTVGAGFVYDPVHQRESELVDIFCSWITPGSAGTTIYMKEGRGVDSVVNMGSITVDGGQEYIIARVNFDRTFKDLYSYHASTNCFAAQGLGQMWAPSDYIYWGTRRGIIKQQFDNYCEVWQNKVPNANQRCLITFSANGIAWK